MDVAGYKRQLARLEQDLAVWRAEPEPEMEPLELLTLVDQIHRFLTEGPASKSAHVLDEAP